MAKGIKGSTPALKPVRTSFIINPLTNKKLNYIAFHTEQDKTTIVDKALNDFINKYEKKNGLIPVK